MANVFLVSYILLLFHSPKGSWNKSVKYEKLEKFWSYCTRNRVITNAYPFIRQKFCLQGKNVSHYSLENMSGKMSEFCKVICRSLGLEMSKTLRSLRILLLQCQ